MLPRARTAVALVLALALGAASCDDGHQFISPKTEQDIAGFEGPPPPAVTAPEVTDFVAEGPIEAKPLTFFKTQDSSEWVTRAFKVQAHYARVIAVEPEGKPQAKVSVSRLDLNAAPGTPMPAEELPVTLTVRTLQEAAKEAKGGDLVAVLPGHYQGFTLGEKADAGDEKYVHFKALGAPGDVVIDKATGTDRRWMVLLQGAHHVILQGFNVAGAETPGAEDAKGPYAGILINGDFVRTSRLSHHIAVIGNFSHHHAKWGLHSVDSHTVLLQDNVFADSAEEHGAYVSDGSDDYVIRRNVFVGSHGCGLQVNVDPLASLEKLVAHPAVEYRPLEKNREWALGLLKTATEKFGANAFPDGRGFNYIIESNVVNGNGLGGGAGINLAGVRESLIQNNLVYGNASSGIAEWDNANPFDAQSVRPGPQAAGEVTGADVLPIFGCFNNVIRNNTVLMAVKSRQALHVGNGSWGTRAFNNVLINDELDAIELLNTSIWRFESGRNVISKVRYEGSASWLKDLAIALPDGVHSVSGITLSALAPSFMSAGDEPWVILDARWWKSNPRRPDFRPRTTAVLLAGRADEHNLPRLDLDGRRRVKADIGAYATAAP
jgi:hypothetical protein